MKRFFCFLLFICSFTLTYGQSYFLVPGTFSPSAEATVDIGVFYGKGFDTIKAKKIPVSQLDAAYLFAERKPTSLIPENKDNRTFLSVKLHDTGIFLVTGKKASKSQDIEREDLQRQLSDEGFEALSEKMEDKDEFNLNNTYVAKALLMAAKPSGRFYEEKTGEDLEIILLQNPYKMNYGEDIIAQVLFKGKPLAKARAEVYTRTLNGSVFAGEYLTGDDGRLNIKLNRSGQWMINCVYIAAGDKEQQAKGNDYDRWCSTFSFGFSPE